MKEYTVEFVGDVGGVPLSPEQLQRKVEALEKAVIAVSMGGVISIGPDGNLRVERVPKFGL